MSQTLSVDHSWLKTRGYPTWDLLSSLEETDAQLLTLRFGLEGGLPMSPEEVGKKMNMTAPEVVAREAAALALLRKEG